MNNKLDAFDRALLEKRIQARERIPGPRIGDYVLFNSGELERFSHNHGTELQTSPSGSFYLRSSGTSELSGGLNPSIPLGSLELTKATLPGTFWFFHHEIGGAGRGVDCEIPCRVYKTSAAYKGYLGDSFKSARIEAMKTDLERQLNGIQTASIQK